MKKRSHAARFIEQQLSNSELGNTQRDKPYTYHYGTQELRDLLDYIYNGKPQLPADFLQSDRNNFKGVGGRR